MDGIRFLVNWVIGMASIVGLFALPISVGKKTGKTLIGIVLYVVELALLVYAMRHFHMEYSEVLMKPLVALALWALTIFFHAGKGRPSNDPISKAIRRKQMKAYHEKEKKHQQEEDAKEKALADAERAELAKETSLAYLEELNGEPSYTFFVNESNPDEESDRLFTSAKYGDPVKILYDTAKEQYYLKFPFMNYYGKKLKERDFAAAKDRLLFVIENTTGAAGIKTQRYLVIAAYEPRKQRAKFYEVVEEKDRCDRVIGSYHLKDLGRVSAGKEKRLLEEAEKYTVMCHVKGERKEENADGKDVIYKLNDKVKIHSPEKAGVVVKWNHFFGYILYPYDISDELLMDTDAHTEGKDVGLVLLRGITAGKTEIHNERTLIPVEGGLEYFDATQSYILEKN